MVLRMRIVGCRDGSVGQFESRQSLGEGTEYLLAWTRPGYEWMALGT